METKPLNTFHVGDNVDVPHTAWLNLTIMSINDSGVGVKCESHPQGTVLSGQSPAILRVHLTKEPIVRAEGKKIKPAAMAKEKATINIPSEVFTVKELAEFNTMEYHEVLPFIKENCEECGSAERIEG